MAILTSVKLDLDAADLRISRGSVPARRPTAEALKAQIIQRLPRGRRLPSEQVSRPFRFEPRDRARGGRHAATSGMASAPARLKVPSSPIRWSRELSCGVRTITEGVDPSCGVTRRSTLSHQTGPAPQPFSGRWVLVGSSVFAGASALAIQPLGPGHGLSSARRGAQPSSRAIGQRGHRKPHMRYGSGDWVYALLGYPRIHAGITT